MAWHERKDSQGQRVFLSDDEIAKESVPGGCGLLLIIGFFISPGIYVERLVFPSLDGFWWFVIAVAISATILLIVCSIDKRIGIIAYIVVSIIASINLLKTDSPNISKKTQIEQQVEHKKIIEETTTAIKPNATEQDALTKFGQPKIIHKIDNETSVWEYQEMHIRFDNGKVTNIKSFR